MRNDRMKKCSLNVIWLFFFCHRFVFFSLLFFSHSHSLPWVGQRNVRMCVFVCMDVWAVWIYWSSNWNGLVEAEQHQVSSTRTDTRHRHNMRSFFLIKIINMENGSSSALPACFYWWLYSIWIGLYSTFFVVVAGAFVHWFHLRRFCLSLVCYIYVVSSCMNHN